MANDRLKPINWRARYLQQGTNSKRFNLKLRQKLLMTFKKR